MKHRYDTLILNRLYIPIHIVSWKRSVSLLYQGLAKSLDQDLIPYEYEEWIKYTTLPTFDETFYNFVHSSTVTLAVPDILVLKEYDRLPRRDVKYSRENLFQRDGQKCAYCGKKFKRDELTVDHILPRSKGGDNSWKNLITSCKKCNNIKADRTPMDAGMPLLFKATEPRWSNSFSKIANRPDIRPNWSKFLDAIGV